MPAWISVDFVAIRLMRTRFSGYGGQDFVARFWSRNQHRVVNLRYRIIHELYLCEPQVLPGVKVMRKVCPQCQASFTNQFFCPNCGIEMQDVSNRSAVINDLAGEGTALQPVGG